MDELELTIRSGAEFPKVASPKSTPLPFIKLEEQEIQPALHKTKKAASAMDNEQQPGAAQLVLDGVEIINFESTLVDIKKEVQDNKNASTYQKRMKEKYPQLDGTPFHLLDEIERLQDLYAVHGDTYIMDISPKCRDRLCVSKYGPWLNLTRLNFPRRKKGKSKAVKEYIIVTLFKDGPFGNWKPYDEDAEPEVAILPSCKKQKVDDPVEAPVEESSFDEKFDDDVYDRMEAFAGAANIHPFTPPVSVKVEEERSDSELSSAKSMDSSELDESFRSDVHHPATEALVEGTPSDAGQLRNTPSAGELASAEPSSEPSPFKLKSASASPEGSSRSGKALSRVRKECMHCGTVASLAWRNGPNPGRNRCMNPRCGLYRDR